MTLEEAKVWIEQQEFVYAKTYDKTFPHYYTTRKRCDPAKFEQFIQLIREHGKIKGFYKKQYLYLEFGEFEYWEVGRPVKCVEVLNKANIQGNLKYRTPATIQEEQTLKEKLATRDAYVEFLLNKDRTQEEENQLTFLLNTVRRIHGGGKNIIDHSKLPVLYS